MDDTLIKVNALIPVITCKSKLNRKRVKKKKGTGSPNKKKNYNCIIISNLIEMLLILGNHRENQLLANTYCIARFLLSKSQIFE